MHAPAGSLDIDDDGVMDHAIHDGGGDDGVAEVVAEGFEANVRCEHGGSLAVAGIDDLEEERGVSGGFLFEAIETYLVNEKDLWSGVCLELLVEASVRETGHEILEHLCGGGVAAPVELLATEQQQCLSDVSFAGAGFSCQDHPLFALDEGQRGQLHDLRFVQPALELEVELRQKLALRELGVADPTLDASLDQLIALDPKSTAYLAGGGVRGGIGGVLVPWWPLVAPAGHLCDPVQPKVPIRGRTSPRD